MIKDGKDKVVRASRSSFSERYLVTILTADEKALEKLNATIEKAGGTIVKSESLGKKPLVFPVNKHNQLTLISVFFEINADAIKPLNHTLKHEDSVERYLLTKWQAEVPIQREYDHDRDHRSRARAERR